MSDTNLYKQISLPPIDNKPLKSRIYKGFSTVNNNTNDWKMFDIDVVKQDLINHFHIRQGEKLNDPTFGTIIWELLYEPLTDNVKRLILNDVTRIVNYDPRLSVDNITVSSYDHGIEVACTLTYITYKITEMLNLQFERN